MNYMRATNFMMLGGLMLGVCVEHSGLHKRIALRIILFLGTSPNMILFGFMVRNRWTQVARKKLFLECNLLVLN